MKRLTNLLDSYITIFVLLIMLFACASICWGQSDPVSLDLKKAGKLYVVKVQAYDKDYLFIVDSGAEMSVVSPEIIGYSAKKLKTLEAQGDGSNGAVGFGANAHAAITSSVNLKMGTLKLDGQFVIVKDMSSISDALGMKISGMLAEDVLSRFSTVTFDYKHRVLLLTK